MEEHNAFRKAVSETTKELLNHPDSDAKGKMLDEIVSAWEAESGSPQLEKNTPNKNGTVISFSDKSIEKLDFNIATNTLSVTDTLANSDQAKSRSELGTAKSQEVSYVAPRVENGRTITDTVNVAFDSNGRSPHIVSVEENDGSKIRKVATQ